MAASNGHVQVVQYLHEKGANINCVDKYGDTPLHKAASSGSLAVVKYITDHGANIHAVNEVGETPLLSAVNGWRDIANRCKVVKYFVEKKKMGITQFSQNVRQEIHKMIAEAGSDEEDDTVEGAGKNLTPLDDRTIKAYQEALKKGKRPANKFKLVFLGAEGAGKTSTAGSLLNKDFQPQQPSTVGAHLHSCTVDRMFVSKWKQTDIAHHLERLPKHFRSEIKAYIKAFTPSVKKPSSPAKGPFLHQEESTDDGGKEHFQPQKMEEKDAAIVREVINTQEIYTEDVNIVMLDLGGQEIYYTIHFLFLAQEDVIFIAFNASQDLNKPVVCRQRLTRFQEKVAARGMQTNLKAIETAMLSVYSHCGKDVGPTYMSNRIPTIVMVATHAKGLSDAQREKMRLFLIKSFSGKPFMDHLPQSLAMGEAFFFIDNSERDPQMFDALRGITLKAAAPTMVLECPISYLQFEADILRESQSKNIIKKQEAADIADKAGLKESLDEVLNHFTMKGTLLYYPEEESLRDHIFISPQEVSNLVSTVISTDNCQPSSAKLQRVCDRYDNYGLLEEALLDDILKSANRSKDKSIVLGFLEKFHLAVKVSRETKFTDEDDSYATPTKGAVYLVPSMLVYNEAKFHKRKPEDVVIFYHFPDKFIPEDAFSQTLVKIVIWSNKHGHHIQSIHHGVGSFRFKGKKQCFTLQQCTQTSSIKLYISVDKNNLSKDELQEVVSSCKQLFHHLQKCIKEVHQSLIRCALEPIGYLECPIDHEGSQFPHLRLSEIKNDKELVCPRSGKVVSLEKYDLLLASPNYRGALRKAPNKNFHCLTEPTLPDLFTYLDDLVDWYKFGAYLLPTDNRAKLEIIKKSNKGDVDDCKRDLYNLYFEIGDVSWDKVVEALQKANYPNIVKKIKEDFY
ncbi:uncharacterized protein [Dysidea avara]|uniref:uncharacterized protein isoform X1 n=1 Tax=Dysidea avara TaxID=196820 RepID=UPI00331CB52D